MTRPSIRYAATVAGAIAALLLAAARVADAEESGLEPAAFSAPALSFFVDPRLPRDLRPVLEEARRRLSDSRCAEVLADFTDAQGRRLDRNLEDVAQTPAAYLSLVLFYDGRHTPPCASRSTLAWTSPGSRAVHVCYDQLLAHQRWNAGLTANTIIHEALHTLGLGETPPDPRVITARVAARCGN